MIEIRSLTALNSTDFERVAIGYSSNSKYVVLTTSVKDRVSFDLQLVALDQPYVKKFDHDNGSLQRYARVLNEDY